MYELGWIFFGIGVGMMFSGFVLRREIKKVNDFKKNK